MTGPAAPDTESKLNYAKKNRVWDLVVNEYFRCMDDLPVRSSRVQYLSLYARGGYRVGNFLFYFLHMTLRSDLPWTIHF